MLYKVTSGSLTHTHTHTHTTAIHKASKMVYTVSDLGFKPGLYLQVSFKINPSCDGFSINIGHDLDNIAFHFNPRHNVETIVMNHKKGYFDVATEQYDSHFPFKQGNDFMVKFSFNQNDFFAEITDIGYVVTFPNRFKEILYNNLHVLGDISVTSVWLIREF